MRAAAVALLLLSPAASFGAVEAPVGLLLGQPFHRILYVLLVWAVIVPLVVVLRRLTRNADDLHRMGHAKEAGDGRRGCGGKTGESGNP